MIDNYIDNSVLSLISDKKNDIHVKIYTRQISQSLQLAEQKFNAQYGNLKIVELKECHDRFLIIDEENLYFIGASLKDLGKKWFAFSKMDKAIIPLILQHLKNDEN